MYSGQVYDFVGFSLGVSLVFHGSLLDMGGVHLGLRFLVTRKRIVRRTFYNAMSSAVFKTESATSNYFSSLTYSLKVTYEFLKLCKYYE